MTNQSLGTRAPEPMVREIEELVDQGKYLNLADFLRCAIRTELEKHKEDS
jgi:Arc/MetJ-type ribon-helix-helix transcriptional regulator